MIPPRPVFIPGSGGDTATWTAQERRFEGAVSLALPGHPDGAPLDSARALGAWLANELADIPGPVVLVGHSLGGAVAMEATLAEPDLVAGLVLVATGARLPVPAHATERARADLDAECARVARSSLVREDPAAVERLASRMAAHGVDALLADYAACASVDLRDRLADIDVPTLVVSAAEDPLTPVWMGEELAAGIPDARPIVVTEASHALMIEMPEVMDLLIAGFLALIETDDAEESPL